MTFLISSSVEAAYLSVDGLDALVDGAHRNEEAEARERRQTRVAPLHPEDPDIRQHSRAVVPRLQVQLRERQPHVVHHIRDEVAEELVQAGR